jgi:hypothetical protein
MVSSSASSGGIGNSKWLMIGALVAAILMGVARLGSGLIDTGGSASVPDPDCNDAIAWDSAADYEGETVTVQGPVVGAAHIETASGRPTFLNVGHDHPDPDRFTVVIWNDVRVQFDQRPEMLFSGQEICVSGEIAIHDDGSTQIVLDRPGAIIYAD